MPDTFIRLFRLDEGSFVTIEESDDEITIRPVDRLTEIYSPERIAEFLLSNAVDAQDDAAAASQVRRMGLDPEQVPHYRPGSS